MFFESVSLGLSERLGFIVAGNTFLFPWTEYAKNSDLLEIMSCSSLLKNFWLLYAWKKIWVVHNYFWKN